MIVNLKLLKTSWLTAACFSFAFSFPVFCQRLAVVEPISDDQISGFARGLSSEISKRGKVLDLGLADTAFRTVVRENYFNLTSAEAKLIGSVIGCDYFILVRSKVQRRSALDRPPYFEAYSPVYAVDSRTGQLIFWDLFSFEAPTSGKATQELRDAIPVISSAIYDAIQRAMIREKVPTKDGRFEEVPSVDSPLSKGLKTPVPYRRIKPSYTTQASLYSITATIEIEVDIDYDGSVKRTSIERWAGFGLDDSVESAVRAMNWRPAYRDGNPLPMRVLLRYNFTKLEKDEDP